MKQYLFIALSMFFLLACHTESKQNKDSQQPLIVEGNTIQEKPLINAPYEVPSSLHSQNQEEENSTTEVIEETEKNTHIVSSRSASQGQVSSQEWYMRILVEDVSNHLKTTATQLGQIDSSENIHAFNLKALTPFGGAYIDVVFKNPIGMEAGQYTSDFHSPNIQSDTWNFTVKSHDRNATMLLSYQGLYILNPYTDAQDRQRYKEVLNQNHPLIHQMYWIDSENREIPVFSNGQINTYLFSMSGANEKDFQLKIKTQENTIKSYSKTTLSGYTQSAKIKALRKQAQGSKKTIANTDFSLEPPKFEVLVK